MLDSALEPINKGLEAIKMFDKLLEEHPDIVKYIYNIRVTVGYDMEDYPSAIGSWEHFDNEAYSFEEKT